MGTFATDIHKFQVTANQAAENAINRICTDIYNTVKDRTPVDTWALYNSWTMSVGALPSSFGGGRVSVKWGDTVYIATNKVYAPIIEYGLYPNPPKRPTGRTINGFSTQAPNGVVRITVRDFENRIKDGKYK